MCKDHLHFPENMPAKSQKLEMVALRKHALPNENLRIFSGAAPLDPALLARCARSGPPYRVVHPARADTQKESGIIRPTNFFLAWG